MVHSKANAKLLVRPKKNNELLISKLAKIRKNSANIILAIISSLWYQDVIILIYCHHLSSVSTLWWHVTQYFAHYKAVINLLGNIPYCITVSKLTTKIGWWIENKGELKWTRDHSQKPEKAFYSSVFWWCERKGGRGDALDLQNRKVAMKLYRTGNFKSGTECLIDPKR